MPPMSRAGSSAACRTPTVSWGESAEFQGRPSTGCACTGPGGGQLRGRAGRCWREAGPRLHPQELGTPAGTPRLRGQRVCPVGGQVCSRAGPGPLLSASWAAVRPGRPHGPRGSRPALPRSPPARCILRPSPTHLVSLEVIVQGELQLAQVLGLLLLLSLPLAFSQARFRIIVILAGTVGKRDLLPDEQSSPAVRGGARCCPGCAQPRRAPRSASGHAAPARPAQ